MYPLPHPIEPAAYHVGFRLFTNQSTENVSFHSTHIYTHSEY